MSKAIQSNSWLRQTKHQIGFFIYANIPGLYFNRWANPGLFFVYFRPFLITISIIQIEKSVDGVLGIRTRGLRIIGADDITELWQPLQDCTLTDGKDFVEL